MIPVVSQPFFYKSKNAGLVAKSGGRALLVSYLCLATDLYLGMFLDYQAHPTLFNSLLIIGLLSSIVSFGMSLFGMLRFTPVQIRFSLLVAGNIAMLWLASAVS